MGVVVLCCGKVFSGKSTFAQSLEKKYSFLHFSADEWMLHFYGEPFNRIEFEEKLGKCKEMIFHVCDVVLRNNLNIALDFGFWTKAERMTTRRHFESNGNQATIVYFQISKEIQFLRMKDSAHRHYSFDPAKIETLNSFFEEPEPEEDSLTAEEYIKSACS